MTIDPDRRMTEEQRQILIRRLAWGSPVVFLITFLVALLAGMTAGLALLTGVGGVATLWLTALPIVIWGHDGNNHGVMVLIRVFLRAFLH
jgi:hypothetical protein